MSRARNFRCACIPRACEVCACRVAERYEYYWRVYTLAFQLGVQLALSCRGLRHIVGVSAPGCNATQSPRLFFGDRGQVRNSNS